MQADPIPDHRLRIWLVDGVDPDFARELVALLSRRFAVPCQLAGERAGLALRWIERRGQVDARALLEQFETEAGGPPQVGIIEHDLAIPVFTHVFGLARHRGHAAVVSLARLRPEFYGLPADRDTTLRRAVCEITHELGHVLGLEHCDDFDCIMHFAADAENIDLRGDRFCADCAAQLPHGWVHA